MTNDELDGSGEVFQITWGRVRGRLRAEAGENAYRSWLKPLTFVAVRGKAVRLAAPTRFMRDWIIQNYADMIQELWHAEEPGVTGVEIVVQPQSRVSETRPNRPADSPDESTVGGANGIRSGVGNGGGRQPERLDVGTSLDRRLTFENFVVGKPNEFAYAAARRVAEATAVPFNPLYLHGPVGLGKTHLMHAVAWEIRSRAPERKVIYLTAEKFMYEFVRALRTKDTVSFKEQFRSVDVLMVDDFQFIGGRDATQEEFFHTFNSLVGQNRQVIISADKSPSDLEGVAERMRSRLGWGLVADIHPTTYELRLGILQSKAERMGLQVPPKVLEFLAHKITSNVRELEGALHRIDAHASLVGAPITLESTQAALQDLLRSRERRITIEEIQKKVSEHFKVRLSDMHSARRSRTVARPRQVAMYFSKQLTPRSLPEIGRKFGGRDHTTVMHAVRRIEGLMSTQPGFAEEIEYLRRLLET